MAGFLDTKHQPRLESLIYLVVWGMLFAAPLLSLYVRTVGDEDAVFDWTEVLFVWRKFVVYLLLFLVHNFLLAPLLVYQQRRTLYLSILAVVIGAFVAYQYNTRPDARDFKDFKGGRPHMERFDRRPPDFGTPPEDMEAEKPLRPFKPDREGRRQGPPVFIGEREILAIVLLLLMFGANLGTKLYFRTRNDQRRLQQLEKQNLEQQLEYLKYQINPHFFMNTLNNIHALVDINPAKAQETILELSKMMRFVLYEGDRQGVPLTREFEFLRTYITLMQLRYTDKVRIVTDLPDSPPDKNIPPLMLVSFVENAFKHGISYQHDSFIEVKAAVDDNRLWFTCRNSKAEKSNGERGGVGLDNVRRRLDLLYENNYTLRIQDAPDVYTVELTIPL